MMSSLIEAAKSKSALPVALSAALVVMSAASAWAQSDYPKQPIKMIVGLAPGAVNDVQTRVIAQKLAERLGQPVVVENRTGAGGNIAAEFVARAAPDGYTLLNAPTSTLVINPAVYSKLGYDPQRDFTPITQISAYPLFLTINASLPVATVKELLDYAKANPDKANLASPATVFDLMTALLTQGSGVKFVTIPFKSTPESMTAILTGQGMIAFTDLNTLTPQLKAGKVRALAATSATRSIHAPDIPSIAEAGYPNAAAVAFTGFVAPKGTPAPIVNRLVTEINAILKMPDVIERWRSMSMSPVESNPEAFGKFIDSEIKRWTGVAKAANIKLD